MPELKGGVSEAETFKLGDFIIDLVAICDLNFYRKYLKSDTDYIDSDEFKLDVVVILKLSPVLKESLHHSDVLFLPDFGE